MLHCGRWFRPQTEVYLHTLDNPIFTPSGAVGDESNHSVVRAKTGLAHVGFQPKCASRKYNMEDD